MIYKTSQSDYLKSFFWMLAVIFCGGFLFYVSLEARHAEEELHRIRESINSENDRIKMLALEITYLSRPDRLESLATNYLGMIPPASQNYTSIEDLEDRIIEEQVQESLIQTSASRNVPVIPLPKQKPLLTSETVKSNHDSSNSFKSLLNNIRTVAWR